MRKSIFTSLLLCVLLAGVLPENTPGENSPSVEKVLQVIASPYEPFVFEHEGELVGFDVDLLDMICRLNNWTYTVDLVPFHVMLEKIAADSADIAIGSIYITEVRRTQFNFTNSYLSTGLVLVSRTDDPKEAPGDLINSRIGVKIGATGEDFAVNFQSNTPAQFSIVRFESTEASFQALRSGEVDAVLNDFINSQFLIANHYPGEFTIASNWQGPTLFTKNQLAYPVSASLAPELDKINQTLDLLSDNGMIDELRQKWLIHTLEQSWANLIYVGGIILLVMIAVLLLYRIYYRQKVTRESQKFYREILEASSDIIAMISLDGEIRYVNKSLEEVLGYPVEYVVGHNITDFSDRMDADSLREFYNKAKRGTDAPVSLSLHIYDAEDKMHLLSGKGKLVKDESGTDQIIVNARDITEKEAAEQQLRQSEAKYRTLIESANDAIIIAEAETGIIVDANKQAANLLECRVEDLIGTHQKTLHPDVEQYQLVFQQHVQSKRDIFETMEVVTKTGKTVPVEISASTVEIEGEVYRQGIFRDIRKRQEAEQEVRLFKHAVESVNECISITDMEDKVLFVNSAFEQVYGYSREELLGQNIASVRPEKNAPDDKFHQDILPETIRGGWSGELMNVRKDGTRFPIRLSTSVIRNEEGREIALIGVARDITEEKKTEKELLRAEKLESLGLLAGGIAHDFNNILTSVIGNISLGKTFTGDKDKLLQLLTRAEESAVRATSLTKQLLTFSKGGQPVSEIIDADELIQRAVDLALSGSEIAYTVTGTDDTVRLNVDPGQMSQALANIILNATQAMEGSGELTIASDVVTVDTGEGFSELGSGKYFRITIQDNGPGIEKQHLDKIFDPFFTTKKQSSGLGLATTYSITRNHGGTVTVDSYPGEGATFNVYLPVSEVAQDTGVEVRKDPQPQETPETGKILVMDDELAVREVCGKMLEHLGYDAYYAKDGQEALEKYKSAKVSDEPFDVVIMDLTIPGGMGGVETIEALLNYDPDVRAIVSSGYSTSPVMANYKEYGFLGVVSKPYQLTGLQQEIKKVLRS